MIKVKCDTLKESVDSLSRSIEEYRKLVHQYQLEYEQIGQHWRSKNVNPIYLEMQTNVSDAEKWTTQVQLEVEAFQFVLDSYERVGNHIECKLENKEYVLRKYNLLILDIEKTIQNYRRVNSVPSYSIMNAMRHQRQDLASLKTSLEELRKGIKVHLETVEEVERQMAKKLDQILYIKSTSKSFLEESMSWNASVQGIVYDVEEINLSTQKLDSYLSDEEFLIKKITYYLQEIVHGYQTDNTDKVVQMHDSFLSLLQSVYEQNKKFTNRAKQSILDYREMIQKNVHNMEDVC